MKRHLEKQKKCIIINNINDKNEEELYNDSLLKKKINEEVNIVLTQKNNTKPKCSKCNKCNKIFNNKSNLNKHLKHNVCSSINIEKDTEQKEVNQITNIQNIGIQNNIINININSLRGFDEDWNISNITKDMREKILLSDKKFTNTLENILKNDENLNIILKDKATGFVYKTKNNDYEVMNVKDILEESMDKIYKHLRYFFSEIVDNNKNDIRIDILENELKEVDKKYQTYKNSEIQIKAQFVSHALKAIKYPHTHFIPLGGGIYKVLNFDHFELELNLFSTPSFRNRNAFTEWMSKNLFSK
jgi:hypothetical protein